MAAKMLQVNQNPGSASPTTDLAFEQVMNLINTSLAKDTSSTSAETNSLVCSSVSSPDSCPGKCVNNQLFNILIPFIPGYKIYLNGQVEKNDSHKLAYDLPLMREFHRGFHTTSLYIHIIQLCL